MVTANVIHERRPSSGVDSDDEEKNNRPLQSRLVGINLFFLILHYRIGKIGKEWVRERESKRGDSEKTRDSSRFLNERQRDKLSILTLFSFGIRLGSLVLGESSAALSCSSLLFLSSSKVTEHFPWSVYVIEYGSCLSSWTKVLCFHGRVWTHAYRRTTPAS